MESVQELLSSVVNGLILNPGKYLIRVVCSTLMGDIFFTLFDWR